MDYKKEILNTNWYFWVCINFYKKKNVKSSGINIFYLVY